MLAMETRRKHPDHYNSTGDLYGLGERRISSGHEDDSLPQGATVVEAFSHHTPKWRRQGKSVLVSMSFIVFLTLVTSSDFSPRPRLRGGKAAFSTVSPDGHQYSFGGAKRPGYFYPKDAVLSSSEFLFAAVTDQDKASRDPSATLENPRFKSILLPGILKRNQEKGMYSVEFQKERELTTKHNEAGRGAEYSDLQLFDNRLLTFDDRTGTVVEILNANDGRSSTVSPRFVFTEGYGHSDKGKSIS
jgi:hypothetical protein